MKKTFTINLSGSIFYIEEDAYEVLQKYMVNLKNYFGNNSEGKEITADIEARIAEIFTQKAASGNKVVTLDTVHEMIAVMGNPQDFSEEVNPEEKYTVQGRPKRKLYRDMEEKVLSGVCGGIAAYFDMDPVIVRIIFVILAFVTTGAAILAYIILWIAVPKAETTSQRLEMRGQEVTVRNIEKFIREEVDSVKDSYNKFTKTGAYSK